ncbi:MAG: L,D-transpeptidase family protein [Fibrobacteria bacterium]|nr:L,D-transpeptidase family protein [Fibrobacteria bacterium]
MERSILRRWAICGLIAASAPAAQAKEGKPVGLDSIVVHKALRQLEAYRNGKVVFQSRVSLGGSPVGDKLCQGDNRTPEGAYRVTFRNAGSQFHKSLKISYPSARDRKESRAAGCSPGGDIMIHGLPNGQGAWGRAALLVDWTAGCVSLTNDGIDFLWEVAPVGTPVVIHR